MIFLMAVDSTFMPETISARATFWAEHGLKLFRYGGVSAVNVIAGQGMFFICLEGFGLTGVVAQFIAATFSAGPAYFLSRRWVWQQSGRDSFRAEVLPFWIMALIGLVFAVSMIAIAERFTDSTILLMATSLGAYGVVWVLKYVILDQVMWAGGS